MKILLPLTAAAAAALSAVPAAAAEAPAARTVAVHIADLDLATASGVATLDRRIRAAVKTACGTASDVDVAGRNAVQRCRADTLAAVAARRDQAIALARRSSDIRLAAQ